MKYIKKAGKVILAVLSVLWGIFSVLMLFACLPAGILMIVVFGLLYLLFRMIPVCRSLAVVISVRNLAEPVVRVKFIGSSVDQASGSYSSAVRSAEELLSTLTYMKERAREKGEAEVPE